MFAAQDWKRMLLAEQGRRPVQVMMTHTEDHPATEKDDVPDDAFELTQYAPPFLGKN